VTFSPSGTGSLGGSITITSNASTATLTIALQGAAVAPVSHSATLSWAASTSSVSGYNVYRSGVSGGPYTLLNSSLVPSLTYTDSTVQAGQTYYFMVTSVSSTGVESSGSNEVSSTIPTP
jgi:fibronectin type 3 domain-containing protein